MRSLAMIGALVSLGLVLASILGGEAQETEGYWFESYEPHQRFEAATLIPVTCERRFDSMGRFKESYRGGMLSALEWPAPSEAEAGLGIDLERLSAWYEDEDTSYSFDVSMGMTTEPRQRSIDELTDDGGRVEFTTSHYVCTQYLYNELGQVVERLARDTSCGISAKVLATEAGNHPDWWEGRHVFTYDARRLPKTATFYQRNNFRSDSPVDIEEFEFDDLGRVLESRGFQYESSFAYEGNRFCPSVWDTTHLLVAP